MTCYLHLVLQYEIIFSAIAHNVHENTTLNIYTKLNSTSIALDRPLGQLSQQVAMSLRLSLSPPVGPGNAWTGDFRLKSVYVKLQK